MEVVIRPVDREMGWFRLYFHSHPTSQNSLHEAMWDYNHIEKELFFSLEFAFKDKILNRILYL